MGFFDKISAGLTRSRDKFKESMNVLLDRGPNLDEDFWEGLEETLILSDIGGAAAFDIVENLRDRATRMALPDAYAVLDLLNEQISATFTEGGGEILGEAPALVLFVGIKDRATRMALPDAYAVLDLLNEQISATFTEGGGEILGEAPALVLFVGINGTGKTTCLTLTPCSTC